MQSWIRWWCLRRYRAMREEQQDNVRRLAEKMRLAACGGRPASEEKIVREFLRLPPEEYELAAAYVQKYCKGK